MLIAAFCIAALAGSAGRLQDSVFIRGEIRSPDGAPIEGANVFVVETLDGSLTTADGRFAIRIVRQPRVTLAARRIGFRPLQHVVTLPSELVVITMAPDAATLSAVRVQAGRWTAGDDRGATLTTLEVVTTPGAAANVNRAIQTLPGAQGVDEGTALFVRGGDYTETKVLLDGATLLNPTQLRTPTGTFTGTVDPFLLDGIFFSSGGFGARYGDALSGIASLRTLGRPSRSSATASVGLAAMSGSVALALPGTVGVRGAGNRLDLTPFLRLNGSPQQYDPPPVGHDASASVSWNYRPSGEMKLFAIDQETRLGIGVDEASFSGTFATTSRNAMTVLNWRDVFGGVAPSLSASASRLVDREQFGSFDLASRLTAAHVSAMVEWQPPHGSPTARAGAEWERVGSGYHGSVPLTGDDIGPDAPTTTLRSSGTGERAGAFAEVEWHAGSRLGLTTGVRTDRSSLTETATVDPRVSMTFAVGQRATLIAAWGIYHQVPGPLLFDRQFGDPTLEPMRAEQAVIGGHVDWDDAAFRLELYSKRYDDLVQLTRDHAVVGSGVGSSRGLDLWLKGPVTAGFEGRVAYSLVSARRTDAVSGTVARAPFDVTNTITALLERQWTGGIATSASYRHATGRPYTPVLGAELDTERDVWIPEYGPPMSERLPAYHRVDVSASYFRRFSPSFQGVIYWSISNLFDRENVHAYRYTSDYADRLPVRSIFNRAHYFGASITWL